MARTEADASLFIGECEGEPVTLTSLRAARSVTAVARSGHFGLVLVIRLQRPSAASEPGQGRLPFGSGRRSALASVVRAAVMVSDASPFDRAS